MKWTKEPDTRDKSLIHHYLELGPDEPLQTAYIEYWKRILADGCASAATAHWISLDFDIAEQQTEDDEQGYIHAVFHNGVQKHCVGHYYVRSDAFTFLQGEDEDNETFNRRQIRWYLEQYMLLKQSASAAEVQQALGKINAIGRLAVTAATAYGDFDLQLGKNSFGRLPSEDRAMLEGKNPGPVNPLKALMGGVMDFD